MKPLAQTYGGDPLAKAHEEMQNNIKSNRGADISPDTMALLSPSQRFQFQNVQDEQRKALRERVAQDRVTNPGLHEQLGSAIVNLNDKWNAGKRKLLDAGLAAGRRFVENPSQAIADAGAAVKQGWNTAKDTVSGLTDMVLGRGEPMLDNNVFAGLDDELAVGGQSPYPPSTQQQVQQQAQQQQAQAAPAATPEVTAMGGSPAAQAVTPEPAAPAAPAATPEPAAPAAPTPSPFITGGSTAIGGTSPTVPQPAAPQPESQNINDWNFFGDQPQQQQGGGWSDWFRPSTYRIFGGGR
jgi:hypothetical protein